MSILFQEGKMNGLTLSNRFVRSATWEGLADDRTGFCTDRLVELARTLADGRVGLIIMGYAYVLPEGKQMPKKTGIYSDDHIPGLRKLCDAVHDAGAKIAAQLVHAGGQTTPEFTGGKRPKGPSAVKNPAHGTTPAEMDEADIQEAVRAFALAAGRANAAGFDAVQLHGAHGYLINQFLSPFTNKRTDAWGGSVENRSRFALAVYQAVREEVGAGYPVFIKLNSEDCVDGGLTVGDALHCAKALEAAGMDAFEISGGTPYAGKLGPARPRINTPDQEAYFLDNAKAFRKELSAPLMNVGGYRSFETAEQAVQKNHTDFIAMSRPFVREPDLVKRWMSGDRAKAACISCNGCFGEAMSDRGLGCAVLRKEKKTQKK